MVNRRLIGSMLLMLLAACAQAPTEPAVDPGAQVATLVEEAWRYHQSRSAYLQVRAGELIRELADFTPESAAEGVAFARSLLERLDELPADELEHEDAVTAAMLRWDAELAVAGEPYYWLRFPYTPYRAGFSFNFVHSQLPAHPFDDPQAHPENYLTVLAEYAERLDQLRAHLEGQIERGIYLSRHALPGATATFESYRALAPRLMTVADERLEALDGAGRESFEAAVAEAIEGCVLPAFDAFLEILSSEDYAAKAPDAVGLAHYPDGETYYRHLVRVSTTLDVTPEELHELGKKRLAEIEAEMAAIREEVGFSGTKDEFHHKLRTDPQFFAETPEEVEAKFNEYIARIEPLIGDYFRTLPEAPYGVKRLAAAAEASMTFGYYEPPTPEEPVGRYRYNGSKLDERPQIWAGPLIYHELVPGHHFHIASQGENEALPMYRRNYLGATAFVEGWGNYGALLAGEMGLLDDPYDRYGAALFDAFITNRLVIDTGMNLLGWSLEEGREHMRRHTFQSETEIATETLRYSTDLNAQALAYKAGLEKLLELRGKAREKAGESFDIRDYHDAVLGSGAMPMKVLEEHVDWYFGLRPQ